MLAYLSGSVRHLRGTELIFVTNGVGYAMTVNLSFNVQAHEVYVWQVQSQDDTKLFGFEDMYQRELAMQLASVQGIGPTIAARLAQSADYATLTALLSTGDAKGLSKLCKGLGEKRAVTIIGELAASFKSNLEEGQQVLRVRKALAALGHDYTTSLLQPQISAILLEDPAVTDSTLLAKLLASMTASKE